MDEKQNETPVENLSQEEVAAPVLTEAVPADGNQEIDEYALEQKKAELQKLYNQSKMSNRILLLLIVLYLLALFLFNNWLLILALCIPMIMLAAYDHKILKRMKKLQADVVKELSKKEQKAAQLRENLNGQEVTSLNQLPKQFTVLDDVDLEGKIIPHVVVSNYGVDLISPEDDTKLIEEKIDNPEVKINYISSELPVNEQIDKILDERESVLDEKQVYEILYKLTGLQA